ncbi:MAG: CPBP family intramembrane glutamic endopeptidase [Acidobacteriota bacterium]
MENFKTNLTPGITPPPANATEDGFDILLRLGLFAVVTVLVRVAVPIFFTLFPGQDPVLLAVLTSFVAGGVANLMASRWFASGRLADFGLGWTAHSIRQLWLGVGVGGAAVACIVLGAAASGLAVLEGGPWMSAGSLLKLLAILLLGVIGEELIFHGDAFQYLTRQWGALLPILLFGALFGLAHLLNNAGITALGTLNTAMWGCLMGYAYWRTAALWLPIGLHFGWNLALVVFGTGLSGITMGTTGLHLRWLAGEFWSGGEYGPEGGVLTTVMAGVVFLVLRRVR